MLKQVPDREVTLDAIPTGSTVLDVGGAAAPTRRATHVLDIVPFEQIQWENTRGLEVGTIKKENYFQHDICDHTPWPFTDKQFDFTICSHCLEDIRDPLWVCHELIRISKAGYIEIPSRLYETTFDLEEKGLAGASHHRWVIDLENGKLRFTFKYMPIHKKIVNKNRIKFDRNNKDMYLCIEWKDTFEYKENWLNSGKEIFEFYLGRPVDEKELWKIFRVVSPRNIISRWLRYLKNTNLFFASMNKKFNTKTVETKVNKNEKNSPSTN